MAAPPKSSQHRQPADCKAPPTAIMFSYKRPVDAVRAFCKKCATIGQYPLSKHYIFNQIQVYEPIFLFINEADASDRRSCSLLV
jgi:hypothetical protein